MMSMGSADSHFSPRYTVFICYETHTGLDLADNLKQALSKRGIRAFVAQEDLPKYMRKYARKWRELRDEAINTAYTFVLILSPRLSKEMLPEVKLASKRIESEPRFAWITCHLKSAPRISEEILASIGINTSELNQVDFSTKEELARQIDVMLDENGCVSEPQVPRPPKIPDVVDPPFKDSFSSELDALTKFLEKESAGPAVISDLIDRLIMLSKERIDKWDVPSTKFATRELFARLYKFSERGGLLEMYRIFKDLFAHAYSHRRTLDSMIYVFDSIMFESWSSDNYDVEKGEKAAKVLLRLGIDFLGRDLSVTRECASAIDNLASDMFEPQVLAKEIILASCTFGEHPERSEVQDLTREVADWIRINDEYSWDAGIKTYLRDSMDFAGAEQEQYGTDIKCFKEEFLHPALQQNIDKAITDYAEFLQESEAEGNKDLTFERDELISTITAYESVRPTVADEIRKAVSEKKNQKVEERLTRIVDSSKLLQKIYKGSEMITTLDELISFFEVNSDSENIGVGMTTFGIAMIDFARSMSKDEREKLEGAAGRYQVSVLAIEDQAMTFEMDSLVYRANGQLEMGRLTSFLRDVNRVIEILSFSTGTTYGLRRIPVAF
jgi:hypothetical protein